MNKHLIPLANKPMIFYAIEKVVEAGVEEIFINLNPGEKQLPEAIGDGGHWGVKINYFVQEGGPQGIAHVVKCAEPFIGNEPFMFYLSDNIILGSLKPFFAKFNEQNLDCMLALSAVPDPQRFGVPIFDENKKLIDVWEKPQNPPNNFAVTGIYLYSPMFFEAYNHIKKSARGEYEISDVHSYFLKNNYKVGYEEITGWWKDTGKAEDLILANELLLKQMSPEQFVCDVATDGDNANKKIHIGCGCNIGENVRLTEPVIIGENCHLENCELGPNVTVGNGTAIKGAKIANSIILHNSEIDARVTLDNSIIGQKVRVKRPTQAAERWMLGEGAVLE